MKQLGFFLFLFIAFSLLVSSCSKENSSPSKKADEELKLNKSKNQFNNFDEMFDFITSQKDKIGKDEVAILSFTYNKNTNRVISYEMAIREPNIIIWPDGATISNDRLKEQYQVDCCCDDEGNDLWNETCDSAVGCGKLVNNCLNAGGCATECNAELVYEPQSNTIYLIHEGMTKIF